MKFNVTTTKTDRLNFYFKTCNFILHHRKGDHKFVYLLTNPVITKMTWLEIKEGIENNVFKKDLIFSKNQVGVSKLIESLRNLQITEEFKKDFEKVTEIPWVESVDFDITSSQDLLIRNVKIYNVVPGVRMRKDNFNIDVWLTDSESSLDNQLNEIKKGRGRGTNLAKVKMSDMPQFEQQAGKLPPDWEKKYKHLEYVLVEGENANEFFINHHELKKGSRIKKNAVINLARRGPYYDIYLPYREYQFLKK